MAEDISKMFEFECTKTKQNKVLYMYFVFVSVLVTGSKYT